MENICFAYPERLSLLLLLLPLAGVLGWGVWRKFRARKRLADDSLAVCLLGRWDLRKEIVFRVMQSLAAGLLLIACCGPQLCSGEKFVRRAAIDIVYVLDVSNSMLARDVAPDRLGRAKREILAINRGLDRGRSGLVAFAGSAIVLCPLTADRQAFETMLHISSPDLAGEQGTNVPKALDMANRILSVSNSAERVPGARIVVLVSDGENHGQGFSGEARKLRDEGVQLIVVGVGKEEPVPIPLGNGESEPDAVKLDAEGTPVLTAFRPETLRRLAEKAGGTFLRSRESGPVSGRVPEVLELDEADTQWVREPRYREEIFHYFVLASVLLLLAAGFVENSEAIHDE